MKSLGGKGYDEGFKILEVNNEIYLTGYFEESISSGNLSIRSSGGKDVIIAKLDNDGNLKWMVSGGGNDEEYGYSICVDQNKRIYVSGISISLNSTPQPPVFGSFVLNQTGLFLTVIDSLGNYINSFNESFGKQGSALIYTKGNLYLSGSFGGFISKYSFTESSQINYINNLISISEQINVFPNPSLDNFNVEALFEKGLSIRCEIFNSVGLKILYTNLEEAMGSYSKTFDMENQQSGIYILNIYIDGASKRIRLVKI